MKAATKNKASKKSVQNGSPGSSNTDPIEGRFYMIHMQICLSLEEYRKKKQPFFVRFLDKSRKPRCAKVESYNYMYDCMLAVKFYHDAPEAYPVQSPVVCFDEDDDDACRSLPVASSLHSSSDLPSHDMETKYNTMEGYMQMYQRVSTMRNMLESLFPEFKALDIGFMNDGILAFFRIRGTFAVAIPSDPGVPMFTWDRKNLLPMSKASPRLGAGFQILLHDTSSDNSGVGRLEPFWYSRKNEDQQLSMFCSVEQLVCYAERFIYSPQGALRVDPEQYVSSEVMIARSDFVRAQIRHLSTSFPHMKVASFCSAGHLSSRVQKIRVYIDMQWRCEVCVLCVFWVSYTADASFPGSASL